METPEEAPEAHPHTEGDSVVEPGAVLPAGPALVGIGASAGGVSALKAFFGAVAPYSGMAFVVIMHLDPEHQSHLAEILQAVTAMPVTQVTDTVAVEPDHVYVIPPNRELQVHDGHLALSTFEEPRSQRMPIDAFFRSLADVDADCYAVILSGGGTDGSVGMKRIKERGGLLMAQAPEEAEFDSMPRAAVATGLVDVVLPVRGLAEHLSLLTWQKPNLRADTATDGGDLVSRIFAQVRVRTGHDFGQYKRATALRRIARRMQVNKVSRMSDYIGLLRNSPDEAVALYKDMLIGVTSFFRDPATWDVLRDEVVPRLFAGKTAADTIRVWTAGCSTGEEAYSFAMLLCEHAETLPDPPQIQIFASDIDEDALAKAREGCYPSAIAADVSETRLARFFTLEGLTYRIRQGLRDRVLFATHNVMRDPPFSRIDLISCRNLLIYLDRELQTFVLDVFYYALRAPGILLLGSSETIGDSDLFWTLDKGHRIHEAHERSVSAPRLPKLALSAGPAVRGIRSVSARDESTAMALHRQALEDSAPPSMLVDAHFGVVHLSETVGRFLQPSGGVLSSDAVRLVRPELRVELRRALAAAFDEGRATLSRPVPVPFGSGLGQVALMVRPRRAAPRDTAAPGVGETAAEPSEAERLSAERVSAERVALVLFIEGEGGPAVEGTSEDDLPARQVEAELHRVREQYRALVEDYEGANEELRSTNEELQSMNEEYRSTTEELETSKEELQSVNEELHTVNHELKNKLDEISQAHSDLQNLMASTEIGTLFLDRELRIKRYTPRMRDFFNIMPADVGRPLDHLAHTFDYDRVVTDAQQVLVDLAPVDREIRARDSRFYLMRLRPYRTVEDRIDGVVLAFVDITARKAAEESLRQSEERLRLVIENARDFAIFTVDEQNRIETWNTGAERVLGWPESEILGAPGSIIFTPEDKAANEPEKELARAREEARSEDVRWHVRRDGTRFWASGFMFRLYGPDGRGRGFAKILRDMTDHKRAVDEMQALNESLEQRVADRTAELNQKNQQIRRLASELIIAEQGERHRIAQVLHDDLQQILFGIRIKAKRLQEQARAGDPAAVERGLASIGEHLSSAIQQARRLSVDLSPPVLKDEGLADALRWLERQFKELYGLSLTVHAASSFRIMSDEMRALLFQIARELIFNIVKHAGTDTATVHLSALDSTLRMRIVDAGRGFDPQEVLEAGASGRSFGLRSIRERVELFGGTMHVESAPGRGATIEVVLPVEWDAALAAWT